MIWYVKTEDVGLITCSIAIVGTDVMAWTEAYLQAFGSRVCDG